MGQYIPQELKRRKLWCVWKRETDPKTGKIKKPCYSGTQKYNGLISKTQLWQWCSYDEAFTKYEYTGEYDGIGFLFHDKGDFVLIDLDHCIQDDGEPNAFASEILELFKGTFVEYSPSGTGLHIIVRGNIGGSLFIAGKIEAYGRGGTIQYGTVTGDVYDGTEPLFMQKELDVLRARFNIQPKQAPQAHDNEPITSDDDRILRLLNDEKTNDNAFQFAKLYAGEFEPCSNQSVERCADCPLCRQRGRLCFRSPSEADFRLIRMIKAYSKNFDQTARLFRNSALSRRKATDAYIRRIFDYVTPYNAPERPQEPRNGARGINTRPKQGNAVQGITGAYKRKGITDQPDTTIRRGFWKK